VLAGLRTGGVSITGTACVPPASRVEIASLLDGILGGINGFKEPAEKALGCLVLLPYLQPFAYRSRRTSRLMANAVLVATACPAVAAQHLRAGLQARALILFYVLVTSVSSLWNS
jgi:hypothetical protein